MGVKLDRNNTHRYVDVTKLSGEPCSAIYLALLEVHAFTGCYYTSALCVKTNLYPVDIVERSV